MTSVTGVGKATTPTVTASDGTVFTGGSDRTAMDTNVFLKLLVAQLQYQDPTKPTDTSAFMSQTAQFTAVERMQQMADVTKQVLEASHSQTATSFVGRQVTYTDVSGNERTGIVTACTVGAGIPRLTVDGLEVELTAVTRVSAPSSSTGSSPAPSSSTDSPSDTSSSA